MLYLQNIVKFPRLICNFFVIQVEQIIKCLNQIIRENKPYNLRLCSFTLHKFQEKNLNLNRDSNSDLHDAKN